MSSKEVTSNNQNDNDIKKLADLFTLLIEIDQDIKKKEKQNDRHN